MSWLSDAWDWGTGLFSSSPSTGADAHSVGISGPALQDGSWGSSGGGFDTSWLGRNWDTIGKVVDGGRKIYNTLDMNSSRSGARGDILDLMQKMSQDDDAYNKQLYDWQVANAASRAAAARANDASRRKAANQALKVQKKMLKQMMGQYQPYADAVQTLTPKMAQNYGQFLDSTALLNQYLTPKAMQTLGQAPKATASFDVPQPKFTGGEPVSLASIEEVLGWKK